MSVLTLTLDTIRARYGHQITAARVGIAAHEAAHAVAAAALGYRVDGIDLRETAPDAWEGACTWSKLTANASDAATIAAAGAVPMAALSRDLRSRIRGEAMSREDVADIEAALPGVTDAELRQARANAEALLTRHADAFNRLTIAALTIDDLTCDEIAQVLGADLTRSWQPSQADSIRTLETIRDRLTSGKGLPPKVWGLISDLAAVSTRRGPAYRVGSTAVETRELIPGLRYSDATRMEVRG